MIRRLVPGLLILISCFPATAWAQDVGRIEIEILDVIAGEAESELDRDVREAFGAWWVSSGNSDAERVKARKVLEKALNRQFNGFVDSVAKMVMEGEVERDDETMPGVEHLSESKAGFVEARLELMSYLAENEDVPSMVLDSFEELCSELKIHISLTSPSIHNGVKALATDPVFIKLPKMDCGGCAAIVKRTLGDIEGICEIETNVGKATCQFLVPRGLDIETQLNDLAKSVVQFESWSYNVVPAP